MKFRPILFACCILVAVLALIAGSVAYLAIRDPAPQNADRLKRGMPEREVRDLLGLPRYSTTNESGVQRWLYQGELSRGEFYAIIGTNGALQAWGLSD